LVHDVILVTESSIIFLDPITGITLNEEALPSDFTAKTYNFMLVEGKLIAGEGSHQIVLAVPNSSTTSQAYIVPPSESKLS
jgi:hypothetical protein